jgi:hypothetical protein
MGVVFSSALIRWQSSGCQRLEMIYRFGEKQTKAGHLFIRPHWRKPREKICVRTAISSGVCFWETAFEALVEVVIFHINLRPNTTKNRKTWTELKNNTQGKFSNAEGVHWQEYIIHTQLKYIGDTSLFHCSILTSHILTCRSSQFPCNVPKWAVSCHAYIIRIAWNRNAIVLEIEF